MHPDPADGLTDELAAQIGAELELAPDDETPASVLVRPGEAAGVEIVLGDEERGDVVVALSPQQARELALALLAAAEEA